MNYQLVNVDVVRTPTVDVAQEAGSGSLSYYVYAVIITITAADVVVVQASSAVPAITAVNGLSFS